MLGKIKRGLLRTVGELERPARAPSPLDFSDDPVLAAPVPPAYRAGLLEALCLEPLVAPTLVRMQPTLVSRESILTGPARDRSVSLPEAMHRVLDRRPSRALEQGTPHFELGMLPHHIEGLLTTPTEEKANPFDAVDDANLPIIPIPRRLMLHRNGISLRGRREVPLRVQAIRRAHQEAFALALARRIEEEAQAYSCKSSSSSDDEDFPQPPSHLWQRRKKSGTLPSEAEPMNLRRPSEEDPPFFFAVSQSNFFGEYDITSSSSDMPTPYTEGPRGEGPPTPPAAPPAPRRTFRHGWI